MFWRVSLGRDFAVSSDDLGGFLQLFPLSLQSEIGQQEIGKYSKWAYKLH